MAIQQTTPLSESLVSTFHTLGLRATPSISAEPPTAPIRLTLEFFCAAPGRLEMLAPLGLANDLAGDLADDADGDEEALRRLLSSCCSALLDLTAMSSERVLGRPALSQPCSELEWRSFVAADGAEVVEVNSQAVAARLSCQ